MHLRYPKLYQSWPTLNIFKVGHVPIHKNGATDELNNYRPISLLSIFNKIMEK